MSRKISDLPILIKRLVLFSCFSLLFYIVLLCVWGDLMPGQLKKNLNYYPGGYGNLNTRLKEAKTKGKVDILFLGSSHAYRGFDVRLFEQAGYSCFNLGSSFSVTLANRIVS